MMFKRLLILLLLRHLGWICGQKISGNVLGGYDTEINKYPHAVFLNIHSKFTSICGGSILNQNIVLSAAHCFDDYLGRRKKDVVQIQYGATSLGQMSHTRMKYYRVHEYYNEATFYGDISLLRCDVPIKLGRVVKRVAIMTKPPLEESAYVCGWGRPDEFNGFSKSIKHTKQKLQSRHTCAKYLTLPSGTFCAGTIRGEGQPAGGDSGGALMIKQFIQIGIVSFKEDLSSLVVYTNVSYYYAWIKMNAVSAYCASL